MNTRCELQAMRRSHGGDVAVVQLTAFDCGLACAYGGPNAQDALASALARLKPQAPVVFLIHGYRYDATAQPETPRAKRRNPHNMVLSPTDAQRPARLRSWPAALGFSHDGDEGLAVCFGWNSLPPMLSGRRNSFTVAYERAEKAAAQLHEAIRICALYASNRRVSLFGHSLGARVAFAALRRAHKLGGAQNIARVIALGAAEYAFEARRTARHCRSDGPNCFNFLARQNDAYDAMLQLFGPRPVFSNKASPLGARGVGRNREGWLDLQIDHPSMIDWLQTSKLAAGPSRGRSVCHWGFYTRPDLISLYRRILFGDLTTQDLKAMGAPELLEPRWARFAAAAGSVSMKGTPATPGAAAHS